MSMGIRATMVRRLGARQPFRLEANCRLEPNECTKLATHPYRLLQTEPADHLIVSVPYISLCVPPILRVPKLRKVSQHWGLFVCKLSATISAQRKVARL